MDREELKRLIRGPIAMVPTPMDDSYRLDYGRMAELTHWWIERGLVTGKSVIKVAPGGGEGTQLGDDEWPHLLQTVVQAANGRVPVMGCIHHKGTIRAIEDAKRAQDLGAIALQVSPPIFADPSQDDMLRHFGAISAAIDIGIMIYNTHWYQFRSGPVVKMVGYVEPRTFARMADFERMVSIKWSVPDGVAYEEMEKLASIFNIVDNSAQPVRCHKLGGVGYTGVADVACWPPHGLRVWELIEERRYDEAQDLWDSVTVPLRKWEAEVGARTGHKAGNKGILSALGQPCGPPRPPVQPLDDGEAEELRRLLAGFGWPVPSGPAAAG